MQVRTSVAISYSMCLFLHVFPFAINTLLYRYRKLNFIFFRKKTLIRETQIQHECVKEI